MKNTLSILLIIGSLQAIAQSDYQKEIITWQKELNDSFKDPESSPLTVKEIKKFKGLEFYPINEDLMIVAKLERLSNEIPFTMPTSSQKEKVFVRYAIAHFTIDGKQYKFPLYQSLQIQQTEEYADYLFAPFTDLTSAITTYGGGRYLDLKIPEGDSIVIDFNKAYNPSCAYSPNYNCPIPPRENDLALEVKAGVMAWENDSH